MFQIEGANIEKQGSDIAPGQRTHVYQKNEVVGTAPTRPAAYRISPTSPWPVTP
jgi:hypothetical protein